MKMLELVRRAKGLSQADLAKDVMYSRSVISRLERHRPNSMTVRKRLRAALEGYFGIPFDALMEDVEPPAKPVERQEAG